MNIRISNLIFALTLIALRFSPNSTFPPNELGTSSDTENTAKPKKLETTTLPLPQPFQQIKPPESRNPAPSFSSHHPFVDYPQQLPQPPVQQNELWESTKVAPSISSLHSSVNYFQQLPQPPVQQNKLSESKKAAPSISSLHSSVNYPQQLPLPSVQASLPQPRTRNKSPDLGNPTKSQSDFHPLNVPQQLPLPSRQKPEPVMGTPTIPPKNKSLMRTLKFNYGDNGEMIEKIRLLSQSAEQPTSKHIEPPLVSDGYLLSEPHKPRKSHPQQTFHHAYSPEAQTEMSSNFKLQGQWMHNNVEPQVFPSHTSTSAQSSGSSTGIKLPQWKGGQQTSRQQAHPLPQPLRKGIKVLDCGYRKKECGRIFHDYIEDMKKFASRNIESKGMWELITNKKVNWKIVLTTLLGDTVEEWRQGLEKIDISIVRGPEQQRTTIGSLRARPFVLKRLFPEMKHYDFIGLVPGTIYYPYGPTILVLHWRIYSKNSSQIPFTLTASEMESKPELLYVLTNPTVEQLQNSYSD